MKVPESDYRATQKYLREKCRQIGLFLNNKTDADILVWLDSQENKQGYLKQLIRADMQAHGFSLPDDAEKENK